MEQKSEVTPEITSDHCCEKNGLSFDESESHSSYKFQIEKQSEEISHLKRENKELKEQLAESQERANRECPSCHKMCPLQATNSTIDHTDDLLEEGLCGQNEGTQPLKGSSEMSKRNDSSQMKDVLYQGHRSPGWKEGNLIDLTVETQSKPSTSKLSKQTETDPEGAAGGCDNSSGGCEFGKSCSLSELKRVPYCHMQLDKLSFSSSHTILVDVNSFNKEGILLAQTGPHVWDKLSVKMPYAEESMQIKPGFFQDEKHCRWKTVEKYLKNLAHSSSLTTKDVENAIKKYNPKYKDQWSFDALHTFFEVISLQEKETHTHTLKRMAELALKLPSECPKSIPLLRHGQNHSITLSQIQIACLLANAFYCTFPHRNATHPQAEYANYPTINFHSLFGKMSERKVEKLKAIFHYFKVVTEKVPRGLVTFSRRYLVEPELQHWKSCQATLTKLHVTSEGTIEKQGQGMLQVDFACNMVGGGVLGSGLVQEEILFLINPELIVARLFTEKLGDTECLKITGSQQYSEYFGYSDSFIWLGDHKDITLRDEWRRLHKQIVAIDALHFKYPREQFKIKNVTRELNKAYCGFMGEENTPPDYFPAIATGNWGCGAFGGDPRLKALIQMMAAAVAKRDMAYFTFGDSHLELDLRKIHHFLTKHNIAVGRLYRMLENFCSALHLGSAKTSDLYSFIMNAVKETTSKH